MLRKGNKSLSTFVVVGNDKTILSDMRIPRMERTEDELQGDDLTRVLIVTQCPGDQRCLRVQDVHHDVKLQDRNLFCQVNRSWEKWILYHKLTQNILISIIWRSLNTVAQLPVTIWTHIEPSRTSIRPL